MFFPDTLYIAKNVTMLLMLSYWLSRWNSKLAAANDQLLSKVLCHMFRDNDFTN